jgi:chromosome segregation ATPase
MSADKELPVVAWVVEHGAVSLPIGDPSRIVTVEAFDNEADADASAQASDFNTQIGPVTWQLSASARIAELEHEAQQLSALVQTLDAKAAELEQQLEQAKRVLAQVRREIVHRPTCAIDMLPQLDAAIASQGTAQEVGK